jgi:hypothetical protein
LPENIDPQITSIQPLLSELFDFSKNISASSTQSFISLFVLNTKVQIPLMKCALIIKMIHVQAYWNGYFKQEQKH